MDSMRAILMMMGIVLHSAQVFNPNKNWLIFSDNTHPLMKHIVDVIHMFRMPAFFIVSGYFCYLTLSKYRTKVFLSVRLKRIVIPLFFTALTLNSLQTILLSQTNWLDFNLGHYLLEGRYISHLWFLTNLIVYFLVTAFLFSLTGGFFSIIVNKVVKLSDGLPVILIVLTMPFFPILIMSLNKFGFPLYSNLYGVFDTYSILIYAPYFVLGMLLSTNKVLLHRFSSINPFLSFTAAVIAIFISKVLGSIQGKMWSIMVIYFEFLSTWCLSALCFYIFYTFFNQASRTLFYLSDAAYTVYLFHHILVLAIGLLLIRYDVPALPGFLLLVATVICITLSIHAWVVSKYKLARYMFNGK